MTADTSPMAAAREAWLERLHHEHETSTCWICGIPTIETVQHAFAAGWTAAMAQQDARILLSGKISEPAP